MRRDVRLRALSSDHHRALQLATTIERVARRDALDQVLLGTIRDAYQRELLPHFRLEEEVLLPALAATDAAHLADRTRAEHRELGQLLATAGGGELGALARFGALLEAHVRFEERELFPSCEARLPSQVLDELARRRPWPRDGEPPPGAPPEEPST